MSSLFTSSVKLPPTTTNTNTNNNSGYSSSFLSTSNLGSNNNNNSNISNSNIPTTLSQQAALATGSPPSASSSYHHHHNDNNTTDYTTTRPTTSSSYYSSLGNDRQGTAGLFNSSSSYLTASQPHYVTLEEFGQLRRGMERERNSRDDTITKLKMQIAELTERQRATQSNVTSMMVISNNSRSSENINNNNSNAGGTSPNVEYTRSGHTIPSPISREDVDSDVDAKNKQQYSDSSYFQSSPPKLSSSLFSAHPPSKHENNDVSIVSQHLSATRSALNRHPGGGNSSDNISQRMSHLDNPIMSSSFHHLQQAQQQSSILGRLERVEAFQLSLPSEFEALEEKVKIIAEERMKQLSSTSKISSLLIELENLSSRMDKMQTVQNDNSYILEHDVARNVPFKAQIADVYSTIKSLQNEVEQYQAQRLLADDARVKLENEFRSMKGHLNDVDSSLNDRIETSVLKMSNSRDAIVESILDRRLATEREEMKEIVRRDLLKLREDNIETNTQMKLDVEQAKMMISTSASARRQRQMKALGILDSASASSPTTTTSNNNINIGENNNENDNDDDRFLEQQLSQKFRHLESSVSSHVADASRQIESKLLTRVREISESTKNSIGEEMSQRLDQQLVHVVNTIKEDLYHDLNRSLEQTMRKEMEKIRRSSSDTSSRMHSRTASGNYYSNNDNNNNSNNNNNNNNSQNDDQNLGASANTPDIILDGVDMFVRELQLENAPIYSQCVDLISDCRARGRTTPADAMLLMWKFMRGHLSNFATVCSNLADARYQIDMLVLEKQEQQQRMKHDNNIDGDGEQASNNKNNNNSDVFYGIHSNQKVSNEAQQAVVENVIDDVELLVQQLRRSGSGTAVDSSLAPCDEFVQYLRRRSSSENNEAKSSSSSQNNSSADAVQLVWLFFRGFLSTIHLLGSRIDRLEHQNYS